PALRRGAADARPGPGPGGPTAAAHARRAVARPGPEGGRPAHGGAGVAALVDRAGRPARGAERAQRIVHCGQRRRHGARGGGGRTPGRPGARRRHAAPGLVGLLVEMSRFIFLTVDGLAMGAVYATFALSLVLIWRAARIVNFAQGAISVAAAYVAWSVGSRAGGWWLGLLLAPLVGALLGVL